jgi:putative redox protein
MSASEPDAADLPAGSLRSVDLAMMGAGRFKATNRRGGVLPIGSGDDPDFTPVELLLAALAGCGAIDLELVTRKRAPFEEFQARATGHKVRDEQGTHLVRLAVTFDVAFPAGEGGDQAQAVVPRTLQQIEDRLCTVGRTVALGEHVTYVEGPLGPSRVHEEADAADPSSSVGSLPT